MSQPDAPLQPGPPERSEATPPVSKPDGRSLRTGNWPASWPTPGGSGWFSHHPCTFTASGCKLLGCLCSRVTSQAKLVMVSAC